MPMNPGMMGMPPSVGAPAMGDQMPSAPPPMAVPPAPAAPPRRRRGGGAHKRAAHTTKRHGSARKARKR